MERQLKKLSNKPVTEGICPLIACSEWCRKRLLEEDRDNSSIGAIEAWQSEVVRYRENADLEKIQSEVRQSWENFKELINREDLRLQIEIEPDKDHNTAGRMFNSFHFRMNLWIRSQRFPLARFAENEKIELNNNEIKSCLENNSMLANLIRQARYSLPNNVRLDLEIFLPIEFLKNPLEEIQFKRGTTWRSLGYEYPVFINSFDRYFDEDFREIREHYYIGTEPSIADLEEIVESLPIAVWSRNAGESIGDGDLNVSEWKNWPREIRYLRRNHRKIALFWDDPYPKPSGRTRPLNTRVVESNAR
jgi:hypothetical protein